MNQIFAFSIDTETKFYDKGDIVFSDQGEIIGRVLKCSQIEIPEDKIHYSYDVESTKDTYEKLKNGEMKIWKLEKYSVFSCSMCYYHENY